MDHAIEHPGARFTVRFSGPTVSLTTINHQALNRVLNAVNSLIGAKVPGERSAGLHVVSVQEGSAHYRVASDRSEAAVANRLGQFGNIVGGDHDAEWDGNDLAGPLEELSRVAKRNGCTIELMGVGRKRSVLAKIGPDSYQQFAENAFAYGDTSVWARVERVGGRTKLHCAIQVPRQHEQIWCQIENEDVARTLGVHLFDHVMIHGYATWYRRTWAIHSLRIRSADPPKAGSFVDAMKNAYDAGGSAWAGLDDPLGELARIRDE